MNKLFSAACCVALLLPAGARADEPACPAWAIHINDKCVGQGITQPADPDRSYHLLTISNGGTVSLIMDLTKRECDEAQSEIQIGCRPGEWCTVDPGDIKSAECFQ